MVGGVGGGGGEKFWLLDLKSLPYIAVPSGTWQVLHQTWISGKCIMYTSAKCEQGRVNSGFESQRRCHQ